jgi:hypothetical protein
MIVDRKLMIKNYLSKEKEYLCDWNKRK